MLERLRRIIPTARKTPNDTEELIVRVYSPVGDLLVTRRIEARREGRRWVTAQPLELVLDGPISVSRITCSTPEVLRFVRPEVELPITPASVPTGKSVTVTWPRNHLLLDVD